MENRIADQLPRPVKRDVPAALHLEDFDPGRLEQVRGVRIPAQRHDGRVLQKQQYVVWQSAGNPILRELTLPLQGFRIRHRSRLNDMDLAHGLPIPLPSAPSPFPLIAQRVARMPNAMFSKSHTISPRGPKKRSSTAARKPTR